MSYIGGNQMNSKRIFDDDTAYVEVRRTSGPYDSAYGPGKEKLSLVVRASSRDDDDFVDTLLQVHAIFNAKTTTIEDLKRTFSEAFDKAIEAEKEEVTNGKIHKGHS